MSDNNDQVLNQDDDANDVDQDGGWHDSTEHAFAKELDAACVKTFDLDFATAVQEYRALEAEFLPRVSDRGFNTLELRRRIAERILDAAHGKKVTFEDCRNAWNELVELGFSHFQRECTMRWLFADCCRKHGQTDMGLATLAQVIAELERLRTKPTATQDDLEFYNHELEPLQKLRAKLEALRG